MSAVVAIVGRPNVGKSTFFNRLVRDKKAIVDNRPGVTRDRLYGRSWHRDREFLLVDTGGFSVKDPDRFVDQIHSQVRQAIDEADVVVLLLDAKLGLSPYDRDLLDLLRPLGKPVFYAANKVDSGEQEHLVADFMSQGLDPVYPISAAHGVGVEDFLDDLVAALPEAAPPEEEGMIRVAVVGRPNVGKSSLVNRVLGSERVLVSDVPGTTRDSVDVVCKVDGKSYVLVDTAGIRRKGKTGEKIEKFSVIRALKSLERADVALLLLDAGEGIADQDLKVAGYAEERGCGVVIVANKWDLVDKEKTTTRSFELKVRDTARFLDYAPFTTISAKTGKRVPRIFQLIDEVYAQYTTRVQTGPVNRILEDAVRMHPPAMVQGRRLKFYYATQVSTAPPTFVAFVNNPQGVHFSYKRYLLNQFRKGTGLDKTPIRLMFRQRQRRDLHFKKSGNRDKKRR